MENKSMATMMVQFFIKRLGVFFIVALPFLCTGQSQKHYDLTRIENAGTRDCWQTLLNDTTLLSQSDAEVMYDLLFGKLYTHSNTRQREILDTLCMGIVEELCRVIHKDASSPLMLFPNPNQGVFHVKGKLPAGSYQFQVLDKEGHTVLIQQVLLNKEDTSIPVETTTWRAGLYFLIVSGSHFSQTLSFIKE